MRKLLILGIVLAMNLQLFAQETFPFNGVRPKDVTSYALVNATVYSTPENKLEGATLVIEKGKLYIQSSAALHIVKHLGGLWPLFYIALIIPPIIRNKMYDRFASKRYKRFGKRETCMIPSEEVKAKFIS